MCSQNKLCVKKVNSSSWPFEPFKNKREMTAVPSLAKRIYRFRHEGTKIIQDTI